jgi:hypothetical protein
MKQVARVLCVEFRLLSHHEMEGRGERPPERQARREMVRSNFTGKAYQLLVPDSRARDWGMRDGSTSSRRGDHIVGMPQGARIGPPCPNCGTGRRHHRKSEGEDKSRDIYPRPTLDSPGSRGAVVKAASGG